MKVPGLRNNSPDDVHWIDITSDVILLTTDSGDIMLQTNDGMYTVPSTIDEWERVLQPLGFEKTDRNSIVKLDKITEIDSNLRLVFFGPGDQKDTLSATVSKSRWSRIADFFKRRKS
ncbi:LytTR family transcriptional regulator DNA-binding domain-containing protein [Paenibacillus sp. IB182496]|uniref:LytTR family transcriptional regulator DNA-binding domain-containing protein n=1 Tax=Paenibacillus sabuli TaxID=2772509 RepID=A0A927BV06_9BACL|nr:LytTR family transcriptional regulator DNA-binding domain-containing protein [Paenibacillus sabuli]MBD2846245.1 LytTR family transcriptional regulator DNA-binding domain-containing protein [Paenibacillus sabuli]